MVEGVTMKKNKHLEQLLLWRYMAKTRHGYTDAELAKKLGRSPSYLSHKSNLENMPYYLAMRLKELAEDG
jgi:hypothetical protein